MATSATQEPMPDVRPKKSRRVSWSFEVYLVGDMVLKKRGFRVMLLMTCRWMVRETWKCGKALCYCTFRLPIHVVCPFMHLNVDEDDDRVAPASFNPFVYPRTQKG